MRKGWVRKGQAVLGGLCKGDGIAATIGSLAAQATMTDPGPDSVLPSPPIHATARMNAVTMAVDPVASLAVPVLAPCTAALELDMSAEEDTNGTRQVAKLSAQLSAQGSSEAVTMTVSSRAIWKLSRMLADIKAAAPPPTTGPKQEVETSHPQEPRRQRHFKEVKKLFQSLDADGSGFLEQNEVSELMNSMYGRYMTVKELELASQQLYWNLTGGQKRQKA